MASRLNHRSPAVKRIVQEMKEMRELMDSSPATPFAAEPLESDIFHWQFVIRGAPSTEFENGIYHGRIILPPDYPFKPPSFIMLTPSGRFETHTKICLSISSFHEESWQPSWSMRTALTALIAFFPTSGKGAVGSMDSPKAERIQMALESRYVALIFQVWQLTYMQGTFTCTDPNHSKFIVGSALGKETYSCGICSIKIPQASSAEKQEVMKRLHSFLLAQDSQDSVPASVCGPSTPELERASTSPPQAASDGSSDVVAGTTGQETTISPLQTCVAENNDLSSSPAPSSMAPAATACCTLPTAAPASARVAAQSTGAQVFLRKCIKALDTILLSLFMILGVIAAWRCTR